MDRININILKICQLKSEGHKKNSVLASLLLEEIHKSSFYLGDGMDFVVGGHPGGKWCEISNYWSL